MSEQNTGMTKSEIDAFWKKYNELKALALVKRVPRSEELRQLLVAPATSQVLPAVKNYNVLYLTPEDVLFLESLKVGA